MMSLEICKQIINECQLALEFSKPSRELENSCVNITKQIYDCIKTEENELKFFQSTKSLKNLYTKGFDVEQVHQQIELQSNSVLDPTCSYLLEGNNLIYLVTKLCSSVTDPHNENKAEINGEVEVEDDNTSDEGVGTDEDELSVKDEHEDLEDDIDFDADTFNDLAKEGESSDEYESDEEKKKHEKESLPDAEKERIHLETNKKFCRSVIDTRFFNLRESEWVADNDIIAISNDSEDIDFMEDIDSGQSDNEIMYDQFFDPPTNLVSKKKLAKYDGGNIDLQSDEEESVSASVEIVQKKMGLSKFDLEMQKEVVLKENLVEENYILEKPWVQKGEATKDQRPENSALEEPLEYNIAISEKPVITESTSEEIEKIILARIKSQSWDDVERLNRPTMDPAKFKERLVIDEEKSKIDLAKIYEEEFLKNQQQADSKIISGESTLLLEKEDEVEPEINRTIRARLEKLFFQLDALSNYHFTPKPKYAELKVVSNLSAITLEEVTPSAATDATLLAPQEIVAPVKGNIKGEREKSTTDKKRERRSKKLLQKRRFNFQEKKLKEKFQKTGKDGLMSQDASVKYVQKALKKGQIKLMKHDDKQFKSSTSFFDHLEGNKEKKRKREEQPNKNKSKKLKIISAASKVKL